uniref:Uncharacterized protein n=1 Tax=Janibacter limosus TaxID=53458 RepID=A0AC61U5H4_9MICO|nr:hypothetical protein [Janibacter limosus]
MLGLGWSCTLIAGSTLLTAAIPLRQRPAAQGLADVAMGPAGGGGGALAGLIVGWWGYLGPGPARRRHGPARRAAGPAREAPRLLALPGEHPVDHPCPGVG